MRPFIQFSLMWGVVIPPLSQPAAGTVTYQIDGTANPAWDAACRRTVVFTQD